MELYMSVPLCTLHAHRQSRFCTFTLDYMPSYTLPHIFAVLLTERIHARLHLLYWKAPPHHIESILLYALYMWGIMFLCFVHYFIS